MQPILLRHKLEFFFLAGMILSLPLFRAPQAICMVGYILAWLSNCFLDRQWKGSWGVWDSLILFWIIATIFVDIAGVLHGISWLVIKDFAGFVSLLWVASRSQFTEKQLGWLLAMLIFSTLIALGQGYWFVHFRHYQDLQLHAVGHINHSAIYIELNLVILFAYLISYAKSTQTWLKTLTLVSLMLLVAGLFIGMSRAAVGTAFGCLVIMSLAIGRRNLLHTLQWTLFIVFICLTSWIHPFDKPIFHPPEVLKKQLAKNVEFANHTSDRAQLRAIALWVWEENRSFGVGMRNFQKENKAIMEKKYPNLDQNPEMKNYSLASHAHNLYFNTLAEQGVVGLIPLLLIFLAWLVLLLRHIPKKFDNNFTWALWLSSLSILLSNVAIGWVNTPLHHQNALLSLLVLGISIAYFKRHLTHAT